MAELVIFVKEAKKLTIIQHLVRIEHASTRFSRYEYFSVRSFPTRNVEILVFYVEYLSICFCGCIRVTRSWLVFQAF